MKRTKIMLGLIAVTITATMLSTSCASNKKDVLYGCDSTNVSYANHIKPIMDNSCNSCHSTANAAASGGGIKLDSYDEVFNNLDTTSVANGGDGGRLLTDVQSGKMPRSAAKLNDCDIAKIKNWIFEGAKNN
jgi:hypothetical protein